MVDRRFFWLDFAVTKLTDPLITKKNESTINGFNARRMAFPGAITRSFLSSFLGMGLRPCSDKRLLQRLVVSAPCGLDLPYALWMTFAPVKRLLSYCFGMLFFVVLPPDTVFIFVVQVVQVVLARMACVAVCASPVFAAFMAAELCKVFGLLAFGASSLLHKVYSSTSCSCLQCISL